MLIKKLWSMPHQKKSIVELKEIRRGKAENIYNALKETLLRMKEISENIRSQVYQQELNCCNWDAIFKEKKNYTKSHVIDQLQLKPIEVFVGERQLRWRAHIIIDWKLKEQPRKFFCQEYLTKTKQDDRRWDGKNKADWRQ